MATLAEIRAKLQAQDDQKSNNNSSYNNEIFPHWSIQEGESAKVRFLPDADEGNTFYWIERLLINLSFAGIKGDPTSKPCTVKVPCMEMWEPVGSCPVLAEIRPWFKDPALEETARKYWKKRSYLMQGFVHASPLKDDEAPENPIRRMIFTPQIFDIVKAALMDPELEELPTDYDAGLDFTINKTNGGQFSSYVTSSYSRKESALTQEEKDAIDTHGLFDLKSFLPKKPDAKALEIIKEMFEASVDGESYDEAKWGEYYKPPGLQSSNPTTPAAANVHTVETPVETTAPVVEEAIATPTPKAEPKADDGRAGNDKAQAILDKIRNRNKA